MKNELVKIANELASTEPQNVVKVASLLRKLKNLWKSITNPVYREEIKKLEDDAKDFNGLISEFEKDIKELSSAIKDGDVKDYTVALQKLRQNSHKFLLELNKVEQKLNVLTTYTKKEMESPGFIDQSTSRLPSGYDVDINEEHSTPLKEIPWYANKNVHISPGVPKNLIKVISSALAKYFDNEEEFSSFFKGENLDRLLVNFKEAIIQGSKIGKIGFYAPGDKYQAAYGDRQFKVRTAHFAVPGSGASVTIELIVIDKSKTQAGNLSILKILGVVEISPPEIDYPDPLEDYDRYDYHDDLDLRTARKNRLIKLAELVPYFQNKLSGKELAEALIEGYRMVFGSDPTLETLGVAWSQVTLENGYPTTLPNNNIGNIKATPDWIQSGKNYFIKDTKEFTEEGKGYVETGTKWKAYATPAEGAAEYWKLLKNRYGAALNWMGAGDPTSAGVALGLKGYYTANIKHYSDGVAKRYESWFLPKVAPQLNLKSQVVTPSLKKPEVKDWVGQYSKKEKEEYLSNSTVANNNQGIDEIDDLINKLKVASVTVELQSLAGIEDKIEFGSRLSSILNKILKLGAKVHADSNNVFVSCQSSLDQEKLAAFIKGTSNLLSDQFYRLHGEVIYPLVIKNNKTELPEVDVITVLANKKKFHLKRMANG